jgi:hypothetical protein
LQLYLSQLLQIMVLNLALGGIVAIFYDIALQNISAPTGFLALEVEHIVSVKYLLGSAQLLHLLGVEFFPIEFLIERLGPLGVAIYKASN